jgi:hypothetical protein
VKSRKPCMGDLSMKQFIAVRAVASSELGAGAHAEKCSFEMGDHRTVGFRVVQTHRSRELSQTASWYFRRHRSLIASSVRDAAVQ